MKTRAVQWCNVMTLVRYISIVAIILGVPLVSAPWWWPGVVGGQRAWSKAQAAEYAQAAANYHRLAHDRAQQPAVELNAAQARYTQNRDALVQARCAGQSAATVMQCLGITTVFAGLLAYSALRQGDNPA